MSQAELSTCSAPQTQRIFQEAVRKGNTQELQSLLQNMTNCEFNVNSFGPEGQTALHQSVIDGNLELVKLLVKFGADIRLANRDGWSALHIAAFGGHQDIVLYLITKAKWKDPRPEPPPPRSHRGACLRRDARPRRRSAVAGVLNYLSRVCIFVGEVCAPAFFVWKILCVVNVVIGGGRCIFFF
uniref:NOTCH regulated ankyrin repeat protein n=1 Tax=Equus caballus TaxID=9796 RepID=A0A9L0SUH6_HORSE